MRAPFSLQTSSNTSSVMCGDVWLSRSRKIKPMIVMLALGCALLVAAPQSAMAQESPVALNLIDEIINAPQIPMPDSSDFVGGNRALIQKSRDSQLKECALYNEYLSRRDTEVPKIREQRKKYRVYFSQQRDHMAKIYRQYELAQMRLQQFIDRRMEPSQIALVRYQMEQLKAKYEEERKRLREAQLNYEKLLERELYFDNLESHFPQCYDNYPEKPDPAIYRFLQSLDQQKKAPQAPAATPAAPSAQPAADPRFSPRKSAQ